jgi:hypothetical protein
MANMNKTKLGALMQTYASTKRLQRSDNRDAGGSGAGLERELCHRIDALGIDAERLLIVDPADALKELEALERQAAQEDAGADKAASRVRAREEVHMHGQAEAQRRDHQMRRG